MTRAPYPSDLTDAQWKRIAPLLTSTSRSGRPQEVDRREIVNAILYMLRSHCSWRMLPHDLPPWGTVHYYFRQWQMNGTWERLQKALRLRIRQPGGRYSGLGTASTASRPSIAKTSHVPIAAASAD